MEAAQGCSSWALRICKDRELNTPLGIRASIQPPSWCKMLCPVEWKAQALHSQGKPPALLPSPCGFNNGILQGDVQSGANARQPPHPPGCPSHSKSRCTQGATAKPWGLRVLFLVLWYLQWNSFICFGCFRRIKRKTTVKSGCWSWSLSIQQKSEHWARQNEHLNKYE